MDGRSIWLATTSLTAALLLAPAAMAAKEPAASGPSNEELRQRVERLEQKVQQTNDTNSGLRSRLSTLEQDVADPHWSFSNGRPTISSGDGRFSLSLRSRFQFDAATFIQDSNLPASVTARDLGSGAIVRRAYFGAEGRVFKDFWYELRLNFGGTASESASLNMARVAYVGIPNFRINLGIMKPVFTYSDNVSSSALTFIERPEIINIAVGSFGASDSRRALEMTFQKVDFLHSGDNFFLSGAYTGGTTGSASGHGNSGGSVNNDEQSQILGRMGYRLFSNGPFAWQVGVSAAELLKLTGTSPATLTTGSVSLGDRPQIRVDGTQLISTGAIAGSKTGTNMLGLDTEIQLGPFFVVGEWHDYNVQRTTGGDAEFGGWYVEGSWILTGETKPYGAGAMNAEVGVWAAPRVARPFSLKGGSWGTWELAARYTFTDLNHNEGVLGAATPAGGIRGGEESVFGLGLNWYLNNNVRLMGNYLRVDVDRLTGAGADLSQEFDILAMRMQFSF